MSANNLDDFSSRSKPTEEQLYHQFQNELPHLTKLQPMIATLDSDYQEVNNYNCGQTYKVLKKDPYAIIKKGIMVIGGAANSGKTTFALQLSADILKHNVDSACVFITLDESEQRAKRKVLNALLTQKEHDYKIRYNSLRDTLNHERIRDLLQSSYSMLERYYITSSTSYLSNTAQALQFLPIITKKQKNIVIVDYLQLVATNSVSNQGERSIYNAILANLKNQLNIIHDHSSNEVLLIILSQLSRQKNGTFNYRETTEIENIADSALTLDYPQYRDRDDIQSTKRLVRLLKNKDGAKADFTTSLQFSQGVLKFEPLKPLDTQRYQSTEPSTDVVGSSTIKPSDDENNPLLRLDLTEDMDGL